MEGDMYPAMYTHDSVFIYRPNEQHYNESEPAPPPPPPSVKADGVPEPIGKKPSTLPSLSLRLFGRKKDHTYHVENKTIADKCATQIRNKLGTSFMIQRLDGIPGGDRWLVTFKHMKVIKSGEEFPPDEWAINDVTIDSKDRFHLHLKRNMLSRTVLTIEPTNASNAINQGAEYQAKFKGLDYYLFPYVPESEEWRTPSHQNQNTDSDDEARAHNEKLLDHDVEYF